MREREADPYWNDAAELGELYLAGAHRPVYLHSHIAEERFFGRGSETLFTLAEREGRRTYVQSRIFVRSATSAAFINRVASAQAWPSPADRTIVLWELIIEPAYRPDGDPREHWTLRQLWSAYEHHLGRTFPDAERLLTTWEDQYDRDEWAGFLSAMGYHKTAPSVFAKVIGRV